MKYNYHTHTKRCGHASGEDDEYVLSAIKQGYKILGFSDHAMFPNLYNEKGMRANFEELEDYINSVNCLKEKYKNIIDIYLGMECEYFNCYKNYLLNLLEENKMDYLIFGNHFLKCENHHIFNDPRIYDSDEYIEKYALHAVEALNSGLFKIFAHPDLVMGNCKKFDEKWQKYSRMMCEAAKKNNVYLEINEAGIRKGKYIIGNENRYSYPYEPFWQIAKEVGNKVIIGVDAHSPYDFESQSHNIAIEFANTIGLNIVDNPIIKERSNQNEIKSNR